uniref:Uncharacterized protein n=1 Tax=candidate division WOR-3 bacterium TaxID=2052148 RepID=A0A7C4XLH9_UNCW3
MWNEIYDRNKMNILFFLIATFDYSLKSRIGFFYDDNIYAYSKKYLNEFSHQIHPERFPFETYDDLYTNYDLQVLIRNKFLGQWTTTWNFDFTGYNYLVNQQKDFFLIGAGIRQVLARMAIKLEFLFIPNYLIRYYKDPKDSKYIGCAFSEKLFSLKSGVKISRAIETNFKIAYEIDDYIENFDVYDSKAIRFGPDIKFSLSRAIELGIDYEFKSSKAKGPTPDISYLQHKIGINTGLKTGIPEFAELILDYQMKYRIFTTEVSPILDTPHSGREDLTQQFKSIYKFPIFTSLYLSLNYTLEFRNSSSEVYPNIGDYKNYNKWMVGVGLEFQY